MNPAPAEHPAPPDCKPPTINRKAVLAAKATKRAKTKPGVDRNARARRRK